jgi:putative DNA primase/helicase
VANNNTLDELAQRRKKKQTTSSSDEESILAKMAAPILRASYRYDRVSGQFFEKSGHIWRPANDVTVLAAIFAVLDQLLPAGFSHSKLDGVKKMLRLFLVYDQAEDERHLLPLNNGVLNLRDRSLRPYTDQDYFRWSLPYGYDGEATCWRFIQFLNESTDGDEAKINRLRALINCLITRKRVQRFAEVIGQGGTGKSTLITLFKNLVGIENTVSTDLENLEKNRFETAALYGKRLAIISDADKWGGAVAVLKAVTGGDPLRFEVKNKQQGESFVFDGLVVVAANQAIQTNDYTSGLSRRRLPVRFAVKVTDEAKREAEKMGGMDAILSAELPGILNWTLDMQDDEVFDAVQSLGVDLTPDGRRHLIETNRLAAWMDECLVIDPDARVFIGHKREADECNIKLYPSFVAWCGQTGSNPIRLNNFCDALMQLTESLEVDFKRLPRSNKGQAVQGLGIRAGNMDRYHDHPTPITGEKINLEA